MENREDDLKANNDNQMTAKIEKEIKAKKQIQKILSIAILLISMIAASMSISLFFKQTEKTGSLDNVKSVIAEMAGRIAAEEKIRALGDYEKKIEKDMAEIKKYPVDSRITLRIKELDTSVSEMDQRLKSLESVIMQNPSMALEIPMLRKDLEVYKDSYQASNIALKDEIERFYDFNKWFLGLMFTMFVSIFGLAIANFLKSKNQKD